jgi:predicted site-specific integrase-resolvase
MRQQLSYSWTEASQISGKSFWTLKRWAKEGKLETVTDANNQKRPTRDGLLRAMGFAPSEEAVA